jgi:hypothetical protein
MANSSFIKELILRSHSLVEEEKNSIVGLLPYMKDGDLERLEGVLVAENEVLKILPGANTIMKKQLESAFEETYKNYVGYKKRVIKVSEENMQKKDSKSAEDQLLKIDQT